MERTKTNKKISAILTSDWHLRETTPICRTDNYWEKQWQKVNFIKELQVLYDCPVLHAGDLFDHWKPSPYLLSETMKHIPDRFYSILGQHDLPQHSFELVKKCGAYTLEKANKIHILPFCHWGQNPEDYKDFEGSVNIGGPKVLIWHHLTYITKPFPGVLGGFAHGILRKYPQFDLIVTGDNHNSFDIEYEGRLLVNPGSLMRMDADQIDFKPRVYLWYAEDNTVKPVYLPIEEGIISREHINHKNERDQRIDAFISKLDGDWKAGLSFEQNLEEFKKKNDISDKVMEIVYRSIEI